jgi:RNA polymerase sigma-70 factor, ECF subfamily
MNNSSPNEQFLVLFIRNQKRIYGLIASLVPNALDADDIMQETLMVMWRRFDEFQEGTDFAAWGMAIARKKIMKYRSSRQGKALMFSDEAVEEIAARNEKFNIKTNDYATALQQCLNKLEEPDRRIIQMRYEREMPIKQLADSIGRKMDNMYKILARIHNVLQSCIHRTMVTWERH